jgi:DNA-binding transcriptional MerR regulator
MKLKIGEFARLGQVSVQTLRYYDDLGLLKPSEIDPFSSYRYYKLEQLTRLIQILALKDSGFSLEQISHLLEDHISVSEMQGILRLKQEELKQQVQNQLEQLERINARLRIMQQGEIMPLYEVILKSIDPIPVALVRGKIPSYWDASPLWNELFGELNRCQLSPSAPCFTLCHATEPDIDVEVCAPLAVNAPAEMGLPCRVLPGVDVMACTIHHGPFTGLITAFTALMKWIDVNNYTIIGPDREIYLRLPEACQFGSDPNAVTELQIPVAKNSSL